MLRNSHFICLNYAIETQYQKQNVNVMVNATPKANKMWLQLQHLNESKTEQI